MPKTQTELASYLRRWRNERVSLLRSSRWASDAEVAALVQLIDTVEAAYPALTDDDINAMYIWRLYRLVYAD